MRILRERVDTLYGVRGKAEQAALRRGDAKAFEAAVAKVRAAAAIGLPDIMSPSLNTSPTASDFNALRDDIIKVRDALAAIVSALT